MSNETKPAITPGNWRAIKMPRPVGYAEWQIAWSDDDELVADVVYTEADAKVMAAAPDLLAALQLAVAALEGKPCRQLALDDARAAIEKATGV